MTEDPKSVLVAGLGNIGTTLAALLADHRALLGIERVTALKTRPSPWTEADLDHVAARGVEVQRGAPLEALVEQVDYVFDCRAAGAPLRDRALLTGEGDGETRRACAQGTEHGFGVPFVGGINSDAVTGELRVQVASCNTHAVCTILSALAGPDLAALDHADFVVVRRAEDVGSSGRMVGASVVARHRDPTHGTHHAVDAVRVFETVGQTPELTSSDVTTPSQLMHAIRFDVCFRDPVDLDEARRRIRAHPHLATTRKLDSNRVFELGRRYGAYGRIYAHAIVVDHDMLAVGRSIKGWAFVPQEGNTLLSTIEAYLRQTRHAQADAIAEQLCHALVPRHW